MRRSTGPLPEKPIPTSGIGEILLWLMRFRRRYRVAGTSMLPLLQEGDQVLIDPRAFQRRSPQCGEIVAARHPFAPQRILIKQVGERNSAGDFVLLGSSLLESTDSRALGTFKLEQILGVLTSRLP